MKAFSKELKDLPLIFDRSNPLGFSWIGIPYSPFDTLLYIP